MMSAVGGWAGGDRQTSVFSLPCPRAYRSASYLYGPSCTKCSVILNNDHQRLEFCNHWDHRLTFEDLVAFVSSKSGLGGNQFRLALDEDGTIVSDVEYLQCLEEGTKLRVIRVESRIEVDGATAAVGGMSVSHMTDEIARADRETLKVAVEKLQRNLESLFVLSQEELQVLCEADEERLQSLMGFSSRREADNLQILCFNLHSEREKRKETVAYLDLAKRANEWATLNESGELDITAGWGKDTIEADGCGPSSPPAVDRSMRRIVGGEVAAHSGDHTDGGLDQGARDCLVQELKAKADSRALKLQVLMGLSENDYQVLLGDDCKGLKALDLPRGTEGDAQRFCEEQRQLRSDEQRLKGYFSQQFEQKAF